MRILITNDDGPDSEGLHLLIERFRPLGEVAVLVPDRPRSGVGHAITFDRPLRLRRVPGANGSAIATLDGTPADCVKFGIARLFRAPPHLVVSGINRGANAGQSASNSGTVAAALQAMLKGITSIALSMDHTPRADYAHAADVGRTLALAMAENDLLRGRALNVNFPGLPRETIRGLRVTRPSLKGMRERFEEARDEAGEACFVVVDDGFDREEDAETDLGALQAGFISLTPLSFGLTDPAHLDTLRGMEASPGRGPTTPTGKGPAPR